ncbi:MAG TPA: hypothetical protein PLI87_22470 [bacterium]|nr:hypothetical protein [bacterium]
MEKKFLRLKEVFFAVRWDNSQEIQGITRVDEQEINSMGPYCLKCGKHLKEHGLLVKSNDREYVCPGNWLVKSERTFVEYNQFKKIDEFVSVDEEISKKLNEAGNV